MMIITRTSPLRNKPEQAFVTREDDQEFFCEVSGLILPSDLRWLKADGWHLKDRPRTHPLSL